MHWNRFAISSIFAALAAAAIAAAPSAGAAVDPTPAPTGTPSRGTVALPPGGPVDTFPQDQTVGGANPYVPFGTDPFVPYGVWAP